jgi:hypothetical protein
LENILEIVYKSTDRYKGTLGGADRFIKDVPTNLEIVNIGSGPGLYAISYEKCWKKGFNFSTAPQSYKYGFRILRRFKDNLCENCIIIIIIMCPLSFGNNTEHQKKGYSDKFYGILDREDIDGYSPLRAFYLRHPLWKKIYFKIKAHLNHSNFMEGKNWEAGIPSVVSCWKEEFNLENLTDATQADAHRESFKEKSKILSDGIQFCKEQSWRPIMVIPPVPDNIRRYISRDFIDRFVYDNLTEVGNVHKDVRLLDYYSDERFTNDLYSSDVFMNKKGNEKFSKILFADIKGTI